MQELARNGVETRPGFYAASKLQIYKTPKLPISEEVGENILCLPCHLNVKKEDIAFISNLIISLKKK